MNPKLEAMQKVLKDLDETAAPVVYIYQATPHGNKGSIMPLQVERGQEIEPQLCEHIEKHGGVTGEFNLSLRSKGKQFKPDGNCTVSFVLKPSSEPIRRANPEPEKTVKPTPGLSADDDSVEAQIARKMRTHVLARIDAELSGEDDPEEPEEVEDEGDDDDDEEEELTLKDVIAQSMNTDEGKALVVGTVTDLVGGAKEVMGALAKFIMHGRTPAPAATPQLGRTNTRHTERPPEEQRPAARPIRSVSLAPAPAAESKSEPEPKKGTGS